MTKYVIIDDNSLYRSVRRNADFAPEYKSMNKIDGARIDKIFSNPVTAIVYDCDRYGLSTEFDKKDIIRALDFWINDKVLENEKLLKLHNRLEDFHETELKDLIRIKDRVLKLPSDSKFSRFVDYDTIRCDTQQYSSDIVEFYHLKSDKPRIRHNHPMISSTETMTIPSGSWSINITTPSETFRYLSEIIGEMSQDSGGRHSDDGHRNFQVQAPNNDPNTWTVHIMGGNPRRWLVRDSSGCNVADNFISEMSAQGFINQRKIDYIYDTNRPNTGTTPRQEPSLPQHLVEHFNTIPYTHPSDPNTWTISPTPDGRYMLVDRTGLIVRIDGTELRYPSIEHAASGLDGHKQLWNYRHNGNGAETQTRSRTTEGEFHPSTLLRDLFTDSSTEWRQPASSTVEDDITDAMNLSSFN